MSLSMLSKEDASYAFIVASPMSLGTNHQLNGSEPSTDCTDWNNFVASRKLNNSTLKGTSHAEYLDRLTGRVY
jgi:hypothetical protein